MPSLCNIVSQSEILRNSKFLKLITFTKSAPACVALPHRRLYSFLSWRNRLKGASLRKIGQAIHMDRRTAKAVVECLADLKLAERTGNNWQARQPGDDHSWIVPRKPVKPKHWTDHFAYSVCWIPQAGRGCPLSWASAHVYSLLLSLSDEHQQLAGQRLAGISAMLRLDRKSVFSAMRKLEALELIQTTDTDFGSTNDRLIKIHFPQQTDLFVEKMKEKKPQAEKEPKKTFLESLEVDKWGTPLAFSNLETQNVFHDIWHFVLEGDRSEKDFKLAKACAKAAGYLGFHGIGPIIAEAKDQNNRPGSCISLLKWKLDQLVDAKNTNFERLLAG